MKKSINKSFGNYIHIASGVVMFLMLGRAKKKICA